MSGNATEMLDAGGLKLSDWFYLGGTMCTSPNAIPIFESPIFPRDRSRLVPEQRSASKKPAG